MDTATLASVSEKIVADLVAHPPATIDAAIAQVAFFAAVAKCAELAGKKPGGGPECATGVQEAVVNAVSNPVLLGFNAPSTIPGVAALWASGDANAAILAAYDLGIQELVELYSALGLPGVYDARFAARRLAGWSLTKIPPTWSDTVTNWALTLSPTTGIYIPSIMPPHTIPEWSATWDLLVIAEALQMLADAGVAAANAYVPPPPGTVVPKPPVPGSSGFGPGATPGPGPGPGTTPGPVTTASVAGSGGIPGVVWGIGALGLVLLFSGKSRR